MIRHRSRRRLVWRTIQLVVAGVATWYLAVPQAPAAWAAVAELTSAPVIPIAVAGLCAFAALVAYAQLLRTALDAGPAPGLWHTFGIIATSLGISNVLPAGSAAGTVATFRMLERAGVPRGRAAMSMAVTSLGSAVVLNILLGLGLIALLPTRGLASGAIAVAPAVVLLGGVVVLLRSVMGRGQRLRAAGAWLGDRFPRAIGPRPIEGLDALTEQLGEWRAEPTRLRRAVTWAVVNWLIDVVALWVVLLAVGVSVSPVVVLVAFGLANIAAMLPLTPGGLGVVELTMAGTLVGFGAPAAATAVGIAIYRLFNFWLPIPLSALAWGATRLATRSPMTIPTTRSRSGCPPSDRGRERTRRGARLASHRARR